MKIGFTGTRNELTDIQKEKLCKILYDLKFKELHIGDCIGADDYAATVASRFENVKIVCHPPIDVSLRAFNNHYTETREAYTYFKRNRNIVDECDIVIGMPFTDKFTGKGGTEYTVNYSVKKKKKVIIIWPNGMIEEK